MGIINIIVWIIFGALALILIVGFIRQKLPHVKG